MFVTSKYSEKKGNGSPIVKRKEMDHKKGNGRIQPSISSSGIKEKKRTSKRKVFQYSWLSMDIFKDWLTPHNNKKALCTACKKVLLCGKSDLIKHSKTKLHVQNIKKGRNVTPSALLPKLNCDIENKDHVNKIKTAEIKLSSFYAEHNIAFQLLITWSLY